MTLRSGVPFTPELGNTNWSRSGNNAGRNILTGPGFAMTNLSLVKNTRLGLLGSGGQFQFRVEVFNLLNRPNFAVHNHVVFAAAGPNEAPLATRAGSPEPSPRRGSSSLA